MLLDRATSQLLVIDVQEKLAAAIPSRDEITACIARLVDTASLLQIPASATEHCSDKIGSTIAALRSRFSEDQIVQKQHFSAYAQEEFQNRMRIVDRPQAILCGMETHVCVLQTALHLQSSGFTTFIVADATNSQKSLDRDVAIQRARQEGVRVVTTEMVLFEWLKRADADEFKPVLDIIKRTGAG